MPDLAEKKQSAGIAQQERQLYSASFSGPLPPPAILQAYENAFPGCAERILAMAERQSTHRQSLESRRIDAANLSERMGQIFGLIVALMAIGSGVYLISIGKDTGGLVAILATLASLVGVFIYGKHKQAEERRQKREAFEHPKNEDKQLELFGPDSATQD